MYQLFIYKNVWNKLYSFFCLFVFTCRANNRQFVETANLEECFNFTIPDGLEPVMSSKRISSSELDETGAYYTE